MEVYYKDLISKDSTLEKLVEDLSMLVQGIDEYAAAAGAAIEPQQREELRSRLRELKNNFLHLRRRASRAALAADKVLHQYPYSTMGFAFGAGILLGIWLKKR